MNRSIASLLLSAVAVTSAACMVDARGHDAEGTFSRTLSVTGPVQLEVETGSGEIDIRATESGSVHIEGRIRATWNFWDDGDADDRVRRVEQSPPIEQSGNDIHVGRWPRPNNVRISYVVTVPRDTQLRVRTGSGDVFVGDLQGPVFAEAGSGEIRIGHVGGDVRARTGSGDVEVLEGAGGVNVTTGSGDVRVKNAGPAGSQVSTGSGDVDVSGAAGPLRVRTGSGEIIVVGTPAAAWELGTGSGDVSINTPATAAFEVDARNSSGDIDARSVVTTERSTRRTLRGTVRGGGPLVALSTGSGEIRIR